MEQSWPFFQICSECGAALKSSLQSPQTTEVYSPMGKRNRCVLTVKISIFNALKKKKKKKEYLAHLGVVVLNMWKA